LDILKIAFLYGADAVYCGTPDFAMRAGVGFDYDTLKEGIEYAHKIGKKVYVTLNASPHAGEMEKL
jgi:putative protease